MSLAVYPGSLDPLTLGHVDIAARATMLFSVIVIGIAHNVAKTGCRLLDAHERLHLAGEVTSHLPGVEMDTVPGLLADYYIQHGVNAVIKGLHSDSDLGAGLPIALPSHDLGAPETVFLSTSAAYTYISSSPVKDAAGYDRDVSVPIPPAVTRALVVQLAQAPESAAHDGVDSGPVPPGTPPDRLVGADHTREDLP